MYTGKKGLYVLKCHVERFQSNGQNPWAFFLNDDIIKELFGKLACEWARIKKKEEIVNFVTRFNTHGEFAQIANKNEIDFSNTELIKLDQTIVQQELGFKVDNTGKQISK